MMTKENALRRELIYTCCGHEHIMYSLDNCGDKKDILSLEMLDGARFGFTCNHCNKTTELKARITQLN